MKFYIEQHIFYDGIDLQTKFRYICILDFNNQE